MKQIFFCFFIFGCLKSFSQTEPASFGWVERSSLPFNIYTSQETKIKLVDITGLTLANKQKGAEFSLLLEFVSIKKCDSIKIICNNKEELLLDKLNSYFSSSNKNSIPSFIIDYLIDSNRTKKLENGSNISKLIFYIDNNPYDLFLTKEGSDDLKSCLCGCR